MKKLIFLTLAFLLLISTQSVAAGTCYNINYSAKYGTKDSSYSNNISVLQAFLREYNFLAPGPSGYFGPSTLRAVTQFQGTYNLPTTGFVGVLTRAKIKDVSCSTSPVTPVNPYNPYIPPTGPIGNTAVYMQNYLSTHTLYDGSNVIYRYKVTAPDNASMSIGNETFTFSQSGVRTASLKLQSSSNDYYSYNTDESYIVYDSALDSSSYLSRDIQFSFPSTIIIPAGQTRYFQVVQQVNARNSGAYVNISNSRMGSERLTTDGATAAASIYITYPNTNNPLTRGSAYTIQWNTTQFDSSRTLNISLINTDGTSYTIGSVTASNNNYGQYVWTIPSSVPVKSGYQVKIQSGSVSDVSDTTFSIIDSTPTITVTSPVSSDVWNLDSTVSKTISWTYSGFGDNSSSRAAAIGIMFGDGSTCGIGNTTLGALSFSIVLKSNSCLSGVKTITPGQYKIGVGASSISGSSIIDYTDASFTVTSNAIDPTLMQVLSPNGGESLTATQATTITWNTPTYITANDYVNVHLDVYTSSATTPYKTIILASGIKNTKTYTWAIPSTLAGISYVSSDRYKISIVAQKDVSFKDASNDYFTINPVNRVITLTAPTATSLARDTDLTVSWNKSGFLSADKINIALTPVGSTASTVLKSSVLAMDGSAVVRIPLATALNSYRITLVPVSYTFGTGSVVTSNLFALTNKSGYGITPSAVATTLYKGDYVSTSWTTSNLTSLNISIRLLTSDGSPIAGVSAVTVAASAGQKDILIPATLPTGNYKLSYEGVSDGATVTAYSNVFAVAEPVYTFALNTTPTTATRNTAVNIGWSSTRTKSADTVALMIKDSQGHVVSQNGTIGANSLSISIPTTFVSGTATIYATTTGVGYTRPVLIASRSITVQDQVLPTITVTGPATNSTTTQVVTAVWQNNNFSSAVSSITSIRVSLLQKKGGTTNSTIIESGLSPSTQSLVIPIATNGSIGTLRNVGIDLTYEYQIKVEALSGTTVSATGLTSGTFHIQK